MEVKSEVNVLVALCGPQMAKIDDKKKRGNNAEDNTKLCSMNFYGNSSEEGHKAVPLKGHGEFNIIYGGQNK